MLWYSLVCMVYDIYAFVHTSYLYSHARDTVQYCTVLYSLHKVQCFFIHTFLFRISEKSELNSFGYDGIKV